MQKENLCIPLATGAPAFPPHRTIITSVVLMQLASAAFPSKIVVVFWGVFLADAVKALFTVTAVSVSGVNAGLVLESMACS